MSPGPDDPGITPGQPPGLDPYHAHSSATRETIFGFMTGRDVEGALDEGDPRTQLIAAYGASRRDPTRPDTAAAAKALGVSQRSVQRWLAGGGITRRHASKLRSASRRAMTTKRGRARAIKTAGLSRRPPGKNAIAVGGIQGVLSGQTGNYRPRTTAVQVTDTDLAAMQQTWVEHGEAGLSAFLHQHFNEHYMGDWHFKSIETLDWATSTHY
ncbi:hypothetical protein [Intrasporangium sp.]|uniref:hypothetical protein n=1 Tax=Intrasporangium sp. TaxID=1925024 RepID=UPI0032218864